MFHPCCLALSTMFGRIDTHGFPFFHPGGSSRPWYFLYAARMSLFLMMLAGSCPSYRITDEVLSTTASLAAGATLVINDVSLPRLPGVTVEDGLPDVGTLSSHPQVSLVKPQG